MNACLQCLLPIEPLRDHFINQDYIKFKSKNTRKLNFECCQQFDLFYSTVFSKSSKQKNWVINPELKKLVRRKFDPIS